VVGGGIAGLTTAVLLVEAGKDVFLLEKERIGEGASARSTGKLTSLQGLPYGKMDSRLGENATKRYVQGQEDGKRLVEEWVKKHAIDCDLKNVDHVVFRSHDSDEEAIQEEIAITKKLGLSTEPVDEIDLPFELCEGIRCRDQLQLNPFRYLEGLKGLAQSKGVKIFEESPVVDIQDGDPAIVRTSASSVKADHVVIATHFPVHDPGMFFSRAEQRRSYIMAAKVKEIPFDNMYLLLDKDEFYSLRGYQKNNDERYIVVCSGKHVVGRVSDTEKYYVQIEQFLRKNFEIESIEYRWSTQDVYTVDGLPFVGLPTPFSKNIFSATGFKGWGLTNGTLAGHLLSDAVQDAESKTANVFSPTRFPAPAHSAAAMFKQNLKSAKGFVSGLVESEQKRVDDLLPGEGAILVLDGKRKAVSRDETGELHIHSPICTHLGCTVKWNSAEKSWDCPCHGSRFNSWQKVLNPPATKPLE
jgi:glycine/D-amino acid oxidase-like deaminating enzyme/nitrite reductase/ring-hydroxylating ferredoxin subunit